MDRCLLNGAITASAQPVFTKLGPKRKSWNQATRDVKNQEGYNRKN